MEILRGFLVSQEIFPIVTDSNPITFGKRFEFRIKHNLLGLEVKI